jgi:hypothetical protein
VVKKPQRCGHEAQSCLRKKRMKDIVNACKTLIDGYSSSSISNGRWYAMWFLTVEEIFPLEDGSPEVWLRSPKQL